MDLWVREENVPGRGRVGEQNFEFSQKCGYFVLFEKNTCKS